MEKTNVRHVRAATRTHIYHRHYKTGYISSVGQVKKNNNNNNGSCLAASAREEYEWVYGEYYT